MHCKLACAPRTVGRRHGGGDAGNERELRWSSTAALLAPRRVTVLVRRTRLPPGASRSLRARLQRSGGESLSSRAECGREPAAAGVDACDEHALPASRHEPHDDTADDEDDESDHASCSGVRLSVFSTLFRLVVTCGRTRGGGGVCDSPISCGQTEIGYKKNQKARAMLR